MSAATTASPAAKRLPWPDRYTVVDLAQPLDDEQTLMLPTALARAGWRLCSAPTHVFRQVFGDFGLKAQPPAAILLQDAASRALYRVSAAGAVSFDHFNVFVQCTDAPVKVSERMRVVVESYGATGVRRLKPQQGSNVFTLVSPPRVASESVESLLAASMKRFMKERVFIETHSSEPLFANEFSSKDICMDASEAIVREIATGGYYFGEDARLLMGKYASPQTMNELGYAVFLMAQTPQQLVDVDTSVLYTKEYAVNGVELDALERLVHANGRFERCELIGPTVGDALRRNDIHYAALHGVFVLCTSPLVAPRNDSASDRKLYAVPIDVPSSGEARNVVWKGRALEEFAKFPSFRAKFELYVQCEGVRQVLPRGAKLLVDLHVIHELPTPSREFPIALLRLHPSPSCAGNASRSAIKDSGYEDAEEHITGGFRRGWYRDNRYWRVVGDHPGAWVSAGNVGVPFERNIKVPDDLGYANTRILVDIPGHGVCYCRGVGGDGSNPTMACVLFDMRNDRDIEEKLAFRGLIGRWADVFQ